MAKNLRDYKRKNIKCLIIEDFEMEKVFKVTKDKEIEECLLKYTENEVTKIFNPTIEQTKIINDIIERSVEGDKVYSKIDGVDMLVRVIPMLTDIKVDLDNDEDIELINEIISDPNDVFNTVVNELNKIIMDINLKWIDNLKLLNELPDDVINVLANINEEQENAQL
jgi:hypothetical protein